MPLCSTSHTTVVGRGFLEMCSQGGVQLRPHLEAAHACHTTIWSGMDAHTQHAEAAVICDSVLQAA